MKMEMLMKSNLQQREGAYLKKLIRAPRGLEKKTVSKYELDQFFNVISLDDLVGTLYQFALDGYFKYEVTLSSKYLDWEEARTNTRLDTSPLKPTDPFGVLRQRKYRLAILDHEIKTDTPLSAAEISVVIDTLPTDMAEQFLRFRLSSIDQKRLREIVASRPAAPLYGPRVDNYYVVGHKGLIVGIADVTYKRRPIDMTEQQRELLRVFVSRPGVKLLYDVFYDNPQIFKRSKKHKNPHATVSKLISATHAILIPVVGECIFNKREDGWYLEIG